MLFSIFWGKLVGKEDRYGLSNINLICSANQGFFGSIDLKGQVSTCGFELANSLGQLIPRISLRNDEIKKWNSVNFLIEKYKNEFCLKCKYFFVCSSRQCPYHSFNNFNCEKEVCERVDNLIEGFFMEFGHML